MKTSYFAISSLHPDAVSIAAKKPDWYNGREYKKLAPKWDWWKKWKDEGLGEEWYKEKYYETVLRKLDPKKVYQELGENAVILCYEKPGTFCHRRLVAEWLEKELKIEIPEVEL